VSATLISSEGIWYRYSIQSTILLQYREELLDSIVNGSAIESPFESGTTYNEAKFLFKQIQDDLSRHLIFDLIALAEAAIRLDYINRAQKRLKDKLSKEYKIIWKEFENKARLKGLLKLWVQCYPESRGAVNRFLQLLPVRHWIAHGRYYALRAKIQDQQIVKETVDEILSAGIIIS
jgi:hypothetical protein